MKNFCKCTFQTSPHPSCALNQQTCSKGQLALIFIDIDQFKDINDTLGHSIGDAYLIEVATRLQGILREQNPASRLGGDEFILMLPNTTSAGELRRPNGSTICEHRVATRHRDFITASLWRRMIASN